jgi:hypothetical protein
MNEPVNTNSDIKLSDLFKIVNINEDTIGIELNKNIVIYNHKNILSISKENNILMGNNIHLNPEINITDFYENPNKLNELLLESINKTKPLEHKEKSSLFNKIKSLIKKVIPN